MGKRPDPMVDITRAVQAAVEEFGRHMGGSIELINLGYRQGPHAFEAPRTTIVMIHGAGGSSFVWQSQIYGLDSALNTLALDLPGHGDTPGPGMDKIAGYAKWVTSTLRDLGLGPVLLMGHSMGGAVALEAALQDPEVAAGIVLAATGARLQVAPSFLQGLKTRFEQTVDQIIHYAYAPEADPLLLQEGAKLIKAAGAQVVHDDFLACNHFDRRQDLARVSCPCLILCGDKDKLTPPKLSEKLHRGLPESRLRVLPSAGHMVMIEAAEAFNRAILEFTDGLSAPGSF